MRRPRLSSRENYLRAASFRCPEYIPCRISPFWPVWNTYRERLEEIARRYSLLFPGYRPGAIEYDERPGIVRIDEYRRDAFGCLWHFTIKGYQGQVVEHPLDDWSKLRDFEMPDPDEGLPSESGGLTPWEQVYEAMERARERGDLVVAGMPHGFFFQRLYYLRGFRNFLVDVVRRPPELYELIEMLTEYNLELVRRLLKFGSVDVVSFGDDLGTQTGMPISPRAFRELILPTYKKVFGLARSSGAHVRLHTDGRVVEVIDQLVEAGVTILNIQDRVNGLDTAASLMRSGVCVDLDIDRQYLVPRRGPEEVKAYIRRVVELLKPKRGGLMMYAEVHPPTPLENIRALAEAMAEVMWLD